MANEVALRPETAIEEDASKRLIGFLKKHENSIKKVLPKHLNEDRFAWLLVNSIRRTPKLVETSPASFFNAVLLASNMGLEIRQNSAYLIPYGKECQLVIDYRGKLELARNAGCGEILIQLVRAGDRFDLRFTSEGRTFLHEPLLFTKNGDAMVPVDSAARGEVVLAYGMANVRNRGMQFDYMTLNEIEDIRHRAKSGCAKPMENYGKTLPGLSLEEIRALDIDKLPFKHPYRCPWVTDWDEMARKTMSHRLCKYLPMTPELLLSLEVDAAVISGAPQPMAMEISAIGIDPEDDQPMLASGTREDQQRVAQEKIAKLSNKPPKQSSAITEDQIAELRRRMREASVSDEESDKWLIWCKAKTLRDLDQAGYALFVSEIEKKGAPV